MAYKSKIGVRDLNSENHWRELDYSQKININKKTIICLSGNATVTEAGANGFCKFVQNLVRFAYKDDADMNKNVDFMGVSYAVTNEKNETGEMSKEERKQIVDNMLLPLCFDDNGNILPVAEASKKFSQIQFVTFCHGHTELAEVLRLLAMRLHEVGYKQEEAVEILSSTFAVNYAAESSTVVMCPEVSVFSKLDRRAGSLVFDNEHYEVDGNVVDGILIDRDLKGVAFGYEGNYAKRAFFESIKIISNQIANDVVFDDEHPIFILNRDKNWELANNYGKNADCISQMMAWAIATKLDNARINESSDENIPLNTHQLYMELMNIEQKSFTQEELKSHTNEEIVKKEGSVVNETKTTNAALSATKIKSSPTTSSPNYMTDDDLETL